MDKNAFLNELANILDEANVNYTDVLIDFESWDSLSILSVIAMADSKFGFTLTLSDIKAVETVSDLWGVFERKRTK